jgi:hypothetical protein
VTDKKIEGKKRPKSKNQKKKVAGKVKAIAGDDQEPAFFKELVDQKAE